MKRTPRIDVIQNADRFWYFRFVAFNGKILAHSETYHRKKAAMRAVGIIMGCSAWPVTVTPLAKRIAKKVRRDPRRG